MVKNIDSINLSVNNTPTVMATRESEIEILRMENKQRKSCIDIMRKYQ